MNLWQRMGYPGAIGFVGAFVAAGIAGMVGLGSYGHLRTKKRWSTWKAGAGAGAIGAGVGAGVSLIMSFMPAGGTAGMGLVSMQPARGLSMRRIRGMGLLTSQRIGQMPTVVAGLTAERLGCPGCF